MITVSPQLVVGASPQRISTTDVIVRSIIIEYAQDNAGKLFVADTEANATSLNRHTLDTGNQHMTIEPDEVGALDALLNLKDIWINGDTVCDRFFINYINITEMLR